MSRFRKLFAIAAQLALVISLWLPAISAATKPPTNKTANGATIKAEDLKEWLGYLASDELEGRNTFTEGLGLAAAYIAQQLKSWGVKPGGDKGSYFQRVPVLGIKSDNKSTITVEANGQTRTFKIDTPLAKARGFLGCTPLGCITPEA